MLSLSSSSSASRRLMSCSICATCSVFSFSFSMIFLSRSNSLMAPSSLARCAVSILSPFFFTMSIMFNAMTTGMPSSVSWVVRMHCYMYLPITSPDRTQCQTARFQLLPFRLRPGTSPPIPEAWQLFLYFCRRTIYR